jgi:hypothetical protein
MYLILTGCLIIFFANQLTKTSQIFFYFNLYLQFIVKK